MNPKTLSLANVCPSAVNQLEGDGPLVDVGSKTRSKMDRADSLLYGIWMGGCFLAALTVESYLAWSLLRII